MSSVDKLKLIQEKGLSTNTTIKKAESLGRTNHVAILSVANAAGFSANIKIEHSPNETLEGNGAWFTLHDFGAIAADTVLISDISANVLPTVRAVISGVSGSADVEVGILADTRGK